MKWALAGSLLAVLIAAGVILLQCEQKKRIQQSLEFSEAQIRVFEDAEYLRIESEKEINKIHEIAKQNIQAVRNITDTPSLVNSLNDIFSLQQNHNQNPAHRPAASAGADTTSGQVPAGRR